MDFSQALMAAKSGERIEREIWVGQCFVVMMEALRLPPYNTQGTARKVNDRTAKWIGEDKPLDSQPYFAVYTRPDNKWQPGWLPTQKDLFADDWKVAA